MRQHGADRLISAPESLGDSDEIGHNVLLLDGVERPGPTHSAHHLIGDQQNSVPIQQLAHALEIAGRGRYGASRRAHDGFRAKRNYAFGPDRFNGRIELRDQSIGVRLL